MALYALLVRHDAYAASQMLTAGSAGAEQQRIAIASYGATMVALYVVSGRFNELLIVDAPTDTVIRAIVMAAAAHGQVIEDMRAFTPAELDDVPRIIERATGREANNGTLFRQ